MDDEYYILEYLLSKKLKVEKKARKLIRIYENSIEYGELLNKEIIQYIKGKLGILFSENQMLDLEINELGGYINVEDAIIDTLNKLKGME